MKTFENQTNTWLPVFSGFYGTLFDGEHLEEMELFNINEKRQEKDLPEINGEELEFDYDSYRQDMSKTACDWVENELKNVIGKELEIKFEKLVSPREYNFSNDSIDIQFLYSENVYQNILKYLEENQENWKKYLERYKSCSGFISSYSHYSDDWENNYKKEFKTHSHYMGEILNFILTNEIEDAESAMADYCQENTFLGAKNYDKLIGEENS